MTVDENQHPLEGPKIAQRNSLAGPTVQPRQPRDRRQHATSSLWSTTARPDTIRAEPRPTTTRRKALSREPDYPRSCSLD